MTAERLRAMDDDALAGALRGLAPAIDWPAPDSSTPDLATRVRVAIVAGDPRAATPRRAPGWWGRPMTRALVLALVGLLALAAVAGAIGLGLPGLRLILGGADATPPPTVAPSATPPAGAPGTGLGLGTLVPLEELDAVAGRPVALPTDPLLGPPDAAWVDPRKANQVALVWAARPDLPATLDPGIGLILMSFDGRVDDGFFAKIIDNGTTVDEVDVGGHDGFWISTIPHVFFYDAAGGGSVDDPRRWVADALLWSDGSTTWRIESALGREATERIAASIPAP